MDVLGLFVLVFFGSFVFGVIPGAWSPGVTTKQSISVSSRITNSAPCVSLHISRLPSHSSGGFCVGSCPFSSFSQAIRGLLDPCPVRHRVHYLVQGVLRAAQRLQTSRLGVPILSHAYGLLQEFIPVVFVYREHDLRCGGLLSAKNSKVSAFMLSLVVSRLVSWSFLVCDGHVHALTQLKCQWTQFSCRWTHLSCRRTQL